MSNNFNFNSSMKSYINFLMVTKNVNSLSNFYNEKFGLTFFKVKEPELLICNEKNITICNNNLHKSVLGGLIKYQMDTNNKLDFIVEYFDKEPFMRATLTSEICYNFLDQKASCNNKNWYSIFRTAYMSDLQVFFSSFGNWTRESHGDGPVHYHLKYEFKDVYEIYPISKPELGKIQFFIPRGEGKVYENFIQDPDGRFIKTLEK